MTAVLDLAIRHRLGDFSLDARLTSEGRLTALFGRSGSGKTSLVNAISGLIRPDSGRIVVESQVLVDTARGIDIPAHRRRIGYVFQEARLFPHLSVRQNLVFGRWFAPRGTDAITLDQVVALLGIGDLVERRPGALSGGERQRVAIGRALLANPRLLLMDEPLAALDEERKAEILPYLERLRDEIGIPIVYVSHSVAEISRLATTIAVLDHGQVAAAGSPADILARFDIARLAGIAEPSAVLSATVAGPAGFGLTVLATPAGELRLARAGLAIGQTLRVRILASDVLVSTARPTQISALNVLEGRIVERASGPGQLGAVDLRLMCGGAAIVARVTEKSAVDLDLVPGRRVFAIVKSVAIE